MGHKGGIGIVGMRMLMMKEGRMGMSRSMIRDSMDMLSSSKGTRDIRVKGMDMVLVEVEAGVRVGIDRPSGGE